MWNVGRAVAALSLGLVACANATNDEPTWPQWHGPRPAVAAAPAPAGPAVGPLADGALGLREVTAPAPHPDSESKSDAWAAFPAHASVFHFLAHVFEAPRPGARAMGYFRRGAQLRASEELGRDGCPGGWHEVWGGGFICRNQGYAVHASASPRPDDSPAPSLLDPLPYRYVKVIARAVQSWRVPSVDEDVQARALLDRHAERAALQVSATAGEDAGTPEDALPEWVRMVDEPGHYLSVAGEEVRDDGQVFVRTVRGAYLPKAATVAVEPPAGLGTHLSEDMVATFGIASRSARRFVVNAAGSVTDLPSAPRGSLFELSGAQRDRGSVRYLQTRNGEFVQASRLARVAPVSRPALVPAAARWVHVDLSQQTLVAYEGERPVFATLISSGKPGFDTPSGLFRVHAKHVTATMDDTALSDGAYYIEDVPWTMYFEGSYALHAAFWHSRFGTPRSHGCVNLAPSDAKFLFRFLDPQVPGGRHGVLVPSARASYVLVDAGA